VNVDFAGFPDGDGSAVFGDNECERWSRDEIVDQCIPKPDEEIFDHYMLLVKESGILRYFTL